MGSASVATGSPRKRDASPSIYEYLFDHGPLRSPMTARAAAAAAAAQPVSFVPLPIAVHFACRVVSACRVRGTMIRRGEERPLACCFELHRLRYAVSSQTSRPPSNADSSTPSTHAASPVDLAGGDLKVVHHRLLQLGRLFLDVLVVVLDGRILLVLPLSPRVLVAVVVAVQLVIPVSALAVSAGPT